MAKPPKNSMTDALAPLQPVHDVLTGRTKLVPKTKTRTNALKPAMPNPQSSVMTRDAYARALNSGNTALAAKLRAQMDAEEAAARKRK